MEFGWRQFKFDRLISVAQQTNRASIRIMEKLDMQFEREFTDNDIQVVCYAKENPSMGLAPGQPERIE
jgi:RimJ/RimL family protein N-acetyltransferase